MTNNIETVEQVCEEFNTPKYTCKNCDFKICPSINMFSDRVLAAHKREIADEKRISDAVVQSLRDKKLEKDREVAEKDNEIASLRAALKPVLDLEDNYDGHWPFVSLAVEAVKEAQRIYKEVKK